MNITQASLKNPAAVAVAVALVVVFGLLAMTRLPLQLFPDIDQPQMSVVTNWRAASPSEIESEILEPQEEVLQGLNGLERIDGNANAGSSWVNLTFAVGTDMKSTLVDVIGRLNRLPTLPADADPPVVQLNGEDANTNLTWFFVQLLPGTGGTIDDYFRFVNDSVKPRLEAVPGVARVEVNGSMPEQLTIDLDVRKAAEYGIAIPQVAQLAGRANDVSGGFVDVGRRQYTLRMAGRYTPQELGEMILAWREGQPVRLADVATIAIKRPERTFIGYQNGNPALGMRIVRESGANVLATLDAVKAEVARLRDGPLKERGLAIEQSFDSGLFINRAINLLSGNLVVGVLLAVGCLWWFLRDSRATLLIASAIPVSLLATFVVLQLAGRSLNVISLAGLAFAVGMVMDAAIVVAENIVRLKEGGRMPQDAAYHGTRQVVGALFASTVTTIAVFLPVLFLEDIEGQLFGDLAITTAIAVAISMLVAVTVLPAAAGGWLKAKKLGGDGGRQWAAITRWIMARTATRRRQAAWALALVAGPALLAWALLPRLDYLPPVKRAAIDVWLNVPPGMSPETVDREIFSIVRARMAPYMSGEKQPQLKNWYIQAWPGGGTIGARVSDPDKIGELERIMRDEIVVGLPDTRAFTAEGELFGAFGGSARAIQIHLQSGDTARINAAAEAGRKLLSERFPGANVQTWPNTDAIQAELRVHPDDRRLAEAGWTRTELGTVIRTLGDGTWLGEYFNGDQRMDIILRGNGWSTPEELAQVALATPGAGVLPLGELARLDTLTSAPQVRRVDRRRTVTLTFDPPATLSLEEALAAVQDQILPALRRELPADASVQVAGSADQLQQVVGTMGTNFVLALLVLFLLMAAMFKSLRDASLVILTMPLALLGGVLGLRALGLFAFQPLDLLSMIGFVMLLGMVVNNAILLITQTRAAQAEGQGLDRAVEIALEQRLRPIFIAALTGVVGSLPMAINPGPGAVIYRGLAAVTVGGVGLSLVFTAILIPALMRLLGSRKAVVAPAEPEYAPLRNVA
ncbi:MAG TPA: efflux RND transporter permease subunit [Pseudomonadota bacterium]|nr:efflux RND transporter permease subunit [Pseudomonadota bacterium]